VKNNKVENNALYTRCPTCSTAFKVTDKLLTMAAGKVRCGACLAIFQATDYMLAPTKGLQNPIQSPTSIDQQPTSSKVANQQTVQSTTMDIQQPLNIEQPIDKTSDASKIQESDLPAELASQLVEPDKKIQQQAIQEKPIEIYSVEELNIDPELGPELNLDPPKFDHSDLDNSEIEDSGFKDSEIDDSEFDDMTFDDPEISGSLIDENNSNPETAAEMIDDDPQIDEGIIDEATINEEIDPITLPEINLDPTKSSNNSLPEELDMSDQLDQLSAIDPQIDPLTNELTTQDETIITKSDFDESFLDETDFLDGTEFIDETQAFDPLDPDEELSDQLTEQMLDTDSEPDPLDEFDNIVEENNNSLKIKLAVASLLVLLIITFTSIWSNRQAIAWSESWGSSMISVCQYLPCDLKPQRDVSKIKLLQRQLSPDEELDNVLDVKILLINEAVFDQPYPTIKIAFSNKNGERVSVKSYAPVDYLDKHSLNDLMPADSEVHIHFKTEMTHPDSLGFEFIFE